MIDPFMNKAQGRPRAIWRIFLFAAALLTGLFALDAASKITGIAGLGSFASPALMVLVLYLAGKSFDKRGFSSYGFSMKGAWWLDMGFGLVLGALLMAGVFGLELATGTIRISGFRASGPEGVGFWRGISAILVFYAGVSLQEETFARAFLLRSLAEGLNLKPGFSRVALWSAYGLSSVLFGMLHALNPNSGPASIAILAGAGLLLGLPFILTGEIALSLGLHLSWNFCQGAIFGFPVSGTRSAFSAISIEQTGPAWFSGGAFGPEGGLVGNLAIALGIGLCLAWVRLTRGSLKPCYSLSEYPMPDGH
jgi:membrane protease YdiL (CAAX protease family)